MKKGLKTETHNKGNKTPLLIESHHKTIVEESCIFLPKLFNKILFRAYKLLSKKVVSSYQLIHHPILIYFQTCDESLTSCFIDWSIICRNLIKIRWVNKRWRRGMSFSVNRWHSFRCYMCLLLMILTTNPNTFSQCRKPYLGQIAILTNLDSKSFDKSRRCKNLGVYFIYAAHIALW